MLTYAVFSDKGDRPYNEDSMCVTAADKKGCFVLADGLGGQGKGDVASKFVVDKIQKSYKKKKNHCHEKFITEMASECQRDIMKIKENEDGLADNSIISRINDQSTDIIADTDCTITSITTRTGIAQVKKGVQVKKGDLLVSGQIPICNDAKEITGYSHCRSDADISGETCIPYQKTLSKNYFEKEYYKSRYHFIQKKEYAVRAGRYMIRIGSVKNTYPYFEKHVFQWQFRPLNIFPLTFEEITVTPYRKRQKNYTKTQIRKILSGDFQNYCKEMKKKGVEIIQNDVKIYTGSETYSAKGTLKVRCSVGKQVPSTPLPPDYIAEDDTKNGD